MADNRYRTIQTPPPPYINSTTVLSDTQGFAAGNNCTWSYKSHVRRVFAVHYQVRMSARKRAADADGRVICPHCNQSVAERTYWLHKRRFYDSARDQWLKDDDIGYSDSDDASVDLHSCSDDRGFLLMESDNDNGEQDEIHYSKVPCTAIWGAVCVYTSAFCLLTIRHR